LKPDDAPSPLMWQKYRMSMNGLYQGGARDVENYTGSANFFKVLDLTPPLPQNRDMSDRKRKFLKKKKIPIVIKNKISKGFY
jgi:hypothetical protein